MSADNWTQCPRCYVTNKAKVEALETAARNAYGKVSPEEFDRLRAEAHSFRKAISDDSNLCETLREDYEIGIRDGEFAVGYAADCRTCGFSFEYDHKQAVQP